MGKGMVYTHTNIIAADWKRLAEFYCQVFQCRAVPPERDLSGPWVDRLTGLTGVRIRGVHLALPGYENGPTLEIFSYDPAHAPVEQASVHRYGFAHMAFLVDSVPEVLEKLLDHGGEQLGELVEKDYGEMGILTAVYARDPEGNCIEIQNWRK